MKYILKRRIKEGVEVLLETGDLATIYRHKSIYDRIWEDENKDRTTYLWKPFIEKI